MKKRFLLLLCFSLLCFSTPALAEQTEITKLKPAELERGGCQFSGYVVRCENGVAIYCEKDGVLKHYSCIGGEPVREFGVLKQEVRPKVSKHHFYRSRSHFPLDFLFRGLK